MKLRAFMKARNLTFEQFGELVGHSPFTVGKWVRDERIPRPDAMRRIEAATDGLVTATDFYSGAGSDAA